MRVTREGMVEMRNMRVLESVLRERLNGPATSLLLLITERAAMVIIGYRSGCPETPHDISERTIKVEVTPRV